MSKEREWMAGEFEQHREHLRGVAYRMLGSLSDADDAVQESWLRVSGADSGDIANPRAWLTTVVARVSLNMLRSRKARREEFIDTDEFFRLIASDGSGADQETLLADSVGLALLVVLERLTPAERLAFVLHDLFDLPFEEIGPIVGRTATAARQLASRARRRVQGVPEPPDADLHRRREVVEAFLAASRRGDFEALMELLDPDAVLRIDETLRGRGAVAARGGGDADGAAAVVQRARAFSRAARFCRVVLLNGNPGVVMAPRGRFTRAIVFTFSRDKIAGIEVIADPSRLHSLRISLVES